MKYPTDDATLRILSGFSIKGSVKILLFMLFIVCLVVLLGYLIYEASPNAERKQTYFPNQTKIEPPNFRTSDPTFGFMESCRSCTKGASHPAGYYCKEYGIVIRGDGAGFKYICDDFEDNDIMGSFL